MTDQRQEILSITGDLGTLTETLSLADSITAETAPETIDLDIDAALA